MSEHGLAPKKFGFSLVQWPSVAHVASPTSAAWCAHGSEAHKLRLLPRESERSSAQARNTRKTPHQVRARAGTWEHGLTLKEGGFALEQCPTIGSGASPPSTARRARATSPRGAALPPQRERAQWLASALHAQATSPSKGQGWHVGARPCIEEVWLLARAVAFRSTCSESDQRGLARAQIESAHAAPPPKRERAQWRASALHAQATSRSEGQGWHVGARPCTEGGRLLARAVPFHGACSESDQRGEARVRNKPACWASSPETASAVARKRATRASHLTE